jgi:predicted RNA methylase
MSRLESKLKLGYYPLPVEEARNISSVLLASGSYSAVDPCAGDGTALLEITKNAGAHLAGIELDADRATACTANGVATVHGSAFECRVAAESSSLLYLNPPYDTESGPHSNERMELVFLEHCYRWVITEGVLVFVIPSTALGRCARLLASQFESLRVFRLEHAESIRFKQVVVFGKRKKSHLRGDPKGADVLVAAGYHPSDLPPLNAAVSDRYAVPPSVPLSITFVGLPLDTIEDALQRSAAMQNARGILVRKHQKIAGRPVTPLHQGHVGLLACSGMLNGSFGVGQQRHIAHWRAVKQVDEFHEEGEQQGETIIRKRERFSHELTLAYEDGRILELNETREDDSDNEKGRALS